MFAMLGMRKSVTPMRDTMQTISPISLWMSRTLTTASAMMRWMMAMRACMTKKMTIVMYVLINTSRNSITLEIHITVSHLDEVPNPFCHYL